MRIIIYFFILIVINSWSCSNHQSSETLIPENTFIKFYADQLILKQEMRLIGQDSLWLKTQLDSLYKTYHISSEQVELTTKELQKDLRQWRNFYNQVVKQLEKNRQSASESKIRNTEK